MSSPGGKWKFRIQHILDGIASCRGRSYSVTMMRVARPLGRGSVFSSKFQTCWSLRLTVCGNTSR